MDFNHLLERAACWMIYKVRSLFYSNLQPRIFSVSWNF
jgi:hypothetical protein